MGGTCEVTKLARQPKKNLVEIIFMVSGCAKNIVCAQIKEKVFEMCFLT